MSPPFPNSPGAPEAQDPAPEVVHRFKVTCRLLRNSGAIDALMPGQRRGESQIDWLVRIGVAIDKYAAAEALLAAKGRTKVLEETLQLLLDSDSAARATSDS